MNRAALYIRVSTEEQARHGLSLNDQKKDLESYARDNGYIIAGEYEDAGISARKSYKKRPALLRLLADCESGKIDTILFIKLDRWFRNVANYYAVQEILDKYHVTWKATQEDYETQTASGRFKVNIMLSVAQDEADRTSERIKFVFDGKRERREPITGHPPAGYKIVNKKIVKDENSEKVISELFNKFLQTGSVSETQKYISDTFGVLIDYQVASKILRSTAYYGYWHGIDGMCEPYITKEQYDKIQSMRRHTVRKTKENRVYIFSGIIFCGECGNRMVGRTNNRSGSVNYCCPKCHEKRGCTNNVFISEKKVEKHLLDTFDAEFKRLKVSIERVRKESNNDSAKNQIAVLKKKISKLKDLYLNDLITLEEYKADQASMTAKIEELEKTMTIPKAENIEKIESFLSEDWQERYENLPKAAKRNAWRILINEVKIGKDRSISYTINA
ncbi:MAG: recombinase family protein [Lachnospiraceae bacterium]